MPAFGSGSSVCLSSSGVAAAQSCAKALSLSPENISIRLHLADALNSQGRHQEAIEVLQKGLDIHPGAYQFTTKLKATESSINERAWIKKQQAQRSSLKVEGAGVAFKANSIRCTRLKGEKALQACNDGLKIRPNDLLLNQAKGDVLMQMERTSEAISAYTAAQHLDPSNQGIASKLRLAYSKRKLEVDKCFSLSGTSALKACESGLLVGADDAFIIWERRGDLLLALADSEGALHAYEQAKSLRPSNAGLQEKLASLEPVEQAIPVSNEGEKKVSGKQLPVGPSGTEQTGPTQVAATISPQVLIQKDRSEVKPSQNNSKGYNNAPLEGGVTY